MLVAWDALRVSLFLFCRLSSQDYSDLRVVFFELKGHHVTAEDCVCLNDRIKTFRVFKIQQQPVWIGCNYFLQPLPLPSL